MDVVGPALKLAIVAILIGLLAGAVAMFLSGLQAINTTGIATTAELSHSPMHEQGEGVLAFDWTRDYLLEGLYPNFWSLLVSFALMVPAMLLAFVSFKWLQRLVQA